MTRPMLWIEAARRNAGLSQTDFAAKVRVAQYFISDIECGKALPIPDQRRRMAEALGIPEDILTEPVVLPTAEPVQS